ncbi:uncharacterized protein V1510DRAFT_363021 [Dipodascopsis tothii]|uniref:uncharacterized protein n=1 Tax=Dipodascopsis tothii TaxID=44089 RepID=UPI0034D0033A
MSTAEYLQSIFSLEGKTALITGATRGIGKNMALALAKAGADIILVQRDGKTGVKEEIEAVGRKAYIYEADLSDRKSVGGIVSGVEKMGLSIDILVNSAGIQRRNPSENFLDEDWDAVIQVNLTTVFTLCRDTGKHMLDRGIKGKIINVGSLQSFQGGITIPAYASAKGGVAMLTKCMSNDWLAKGINVNGIAPGYIATEMNSALIADPVRSEQIMARIPAKRWGSPADFEGVVVFLASHGSDFMGGEMVLVDGGWMAR